MTDFKAAAALEELVLTIASIKFCTDALDNAERSLNGSVMTADHLIKGFQDVKLSTYPEYVESAIQKWDDKLAKNQPNNIKTIEKRTPEHLRYLIKPALEGFIENLLIHVSGNIKHEPLEYTKLATACATLKIGGIVTKLRELANNNK